VIEGRHDKIFPMFEFESKGGVEELKKMESELLAYLGFDKPKTLDYEEVCSSFGVGVLEAEHEERMAEEFGNSLFLEKFPQRTSPFWNMKPTTFGKGSRSPNHPEKVFNKVDVLLYGMETIGSAERSSNTEEMRNNFLKISNGKYAGLLFGQFGKERVMKELEGYLAHKMFERYGGGIGVTRMARAMKLAGLLRDGLEGKRIESEE